MQWIADLTPVLYLVRDLIYIILATTFTSAIIGWGVVRLTRRRLK